MPGLSWLDKYLAATPADGAAVAQRTTDPRGPSTGSVWKDAVGGYGQFSPSARGDATLGLVNQLVNPLRQADQVGEDAGSGHPIRAAVGAAGLAAPLAMHYAAGPLAELLAKIAPKGYEAGEVAAHAPASPGYNGGRGVPPAPVPDAPAPPQNLGIGGGGQPGDFIQGAQMNMAPGAADAQMLQNARRANVGDPAPVAPRPLLTAPTNTIAGRMDGLDPSLYTRKTMSDATAVAKPSLPPLNAAEQKYADYLRSTGVKDPEWTAYRDLRLRGNDPPSYGTMADSLMSGAAHNFFGHQTNVSDADQLLSASTHSGGDKIQNMMKMDKSAPAISTPKYAKPNKVIYSPDHPDAGNLRGSTKGLLDERIGGGNYTPEVTSAANDIVDAHAAYLAKPSRANKNAYDAAETAFAKARKAQ